MLYRVVHEKLAHLNFSSSKHSHMITVAPRAAGMPMD